MTTLPSWLRGTLTKHERDAIDCLRDLLDAAWERGVCHAENITHTPSEPNVIGCTFKRLRSCGLYQTDTRIKPTQRRKHGRPLYEWRVNDHARLETIRDAIAARNRETLLSEPQSAGGQYLLGM